MLLRKVLTEICLVIYGNFRCCRKLNKWLPKAKFLGLLFYLFIYFIYSLFCFCFCLLETLNTDCLNTKASNIIFDRRYHDGTKLKLIFLRNKKHLF